MEIDGAAAKASGSRRRKSASASASCDRLADRRQHLRRVRLQLGDQPVGAHQEEAAVPEAPAAQSRSASGRGGFSTKRATRRTPSASGSPGSM